MERKSTPAPSMMLLFTITFTGCMGYVPGQQSYWDAQVREMCAKDGGVQILEKVILTKQEATSMPQVDGKISTRSNANSLGRDPVYSEGKISYLRESNPRVSREEVAVIRRADQKVVARWVEYARIGGDMPTGLAHHSSLRCPDSKQRLEELQHLFVIQY
ncbi:MAG: hypothetical protein KIT13_12395 [Burkholderiales bacterium]|nr:hypothetical protein [Burkholderiales bacterium]